MLFHAGRWSAGLSGKRFLNLADVFDQLLDTGAKPSWASCELLGNRRVSDRESKRNRDTSTLATTRLEGFERCRYDASVTMQAWQSRAAPSTR